MCLLIMFLSSWFQSKNHANIHYFFNSIPTIPELCIFLPEFYKNTQRFAISFHDITKITPNSSEKAFYLSTITSPLAP